MMRWTKTNPTTAGSERDPLDTALMAVGVLVLASVLIARSLLLSGPSEPPASPEVNHADATPRMTEGPRDVSAASALVPVRATADPPAEDLLARLAAWRTVAVERVRSAVRQAVIFAFVLPWPDGEPDARDARTTVDRSANESGERAPDDVGDSAGVAEPEPIGPDSFPA